MLARCTVVHRLQPAPAAGVDRPGATSRRMLGDARLHNSLRVTFTYVFVSVPLQLVPGAGARAGARPRAARAGVLPLGVLPAVAARRRSVAIAMLWRQIFGTDGLVNQVLALVRHRGPGLDLRPGHRAGHADPAARLDLRLADGHLPGRPAADPGDVLRGRRGRRRRTGGRQFRKITLPLLSPIIFFNLVLQIIGAFQSFTQAFVVSGGTGGPSDSTLFYTLYLYQQGFGHFDMGYASAHGLAAAAHHRRASPPSTSSLSSIGCSTMTDTSARRRSPRPPSPPRDRRQPHAPLRCSSTSLIAA